MQGAAGRIKRPPAHRFWLQGAPGKQQMLQLGERLAGPVDGGVGVHQAGAQTSCEAQGRLGALEIATEPEQVVGRPARQVAEDAADLDILLAGQQRRPLHGRVTNHPHVSGMRAFAHGDGPDVRAVRGAAEAAWHRG